MRSRICYAQWSRHATGNSRRVDRARANEAIGYSNWRRRSRNTCGVNEFDPVPMRTSRLDKIVSTYRVRIDTKTAGMLTHPSFTSPAYSQCSTTSGAVLIAQVLLVIHFAEVPSRRRSGGIVPMGFADDIGVFAQPNHFLEVCRGRSGIDDVSRVKLP